MTEVQVRRAADGQIISVEANGHAGFAQEGEDIVCAGISALVATALLGLSHVAAHPHQGSIKPGRMYCKVNSGGTLESAQKAQIVLETIVWGLRDIEKDYPKFIRVTEGG